MLSFSDKYEHALDQKNRLFIPAKFREGLGETFHVFIPPKKGKKNQYIALYPQQQWEELIRDAEEKFSGETRTEALRILYANMATVTPDKQGRITLRPQFCEHAGLEGGTVSIVGAGRKVEVWKPEWYEAVCEESKQTLVLDLAF